MFKRDQWEEIIYTISKNKLRTALSGFTIALGVFIFVVLFGFGNGLKNGFSNFFMNDNDIRVMRIFPTKTFIPYRGLKSQRQIRFENEDLKIIEENFGDYIDGISPRLNRNFLAL
jgi:putative ABC transport system permease protein